MSLIGEATACGDLSHRLCSTCHELDGPCQAALQHEGVWRHANGVAKRSGKVRAADPGYRTELYELEIACQIRFDVVDNAASLCWYEHL
jgi:hypothetical protein